MVAGVLFTAESAEIFGAGGYPLLEKLRKTFCWVLAGVGSAALTGYSAGNTLKRQVVVLLQAASR